MELRGFDSYEISLGDQMRGERASMGKSLECVERDLRIKATMIDAIESCKLDVFPNQSVIAGYVRSYARYLKMDAEDCYLRFCQESGYQSPSAVTLVGADGAPSDRQPSLALASSVGAGLSQSRFAAPPQQNRFQVRVSLGALTSTAALLALICGLGYGGYALLQDIQRVGFAPLPEAPVVVADAPLIEAPEIGFETAPRPNADDYLGGGVLANMAPPADLPTVNLIRRDGPISAIDPKTAGIFTHEGAPTMPAVDSADDVIRSADRRSISIPLEPAEARDTTSTLAAIIPGVVLHAAEDAWIRVRERDSTVIFEGTLGAGEQFTLPARTDAPILKAGNAGGIFVFVDGVAYGPVGQRGQVARNVSLRADDVRTLMPQASSAEVETDALATAQRRAEAEIRAD